MRCHWLLAIMFSLAPMAQAQLEMTVNGEPFPLEPGYFVSFGQTRVGVPVSMAFNLRNTAPTPVYLGSLEIPQGFTLPQGLPKEIPANGAVQFPVVMVADAPVPYWGALYFTSSSPDHFQIEIHLDGEVIGTSPALLSMNAYPSYFGEDAPAGAAFGVVFRGDYTGDAQVALTSSDPTRLAVPDKVWIPSDAASATFALMPQNNERKDGSQEITITAQAQSYTTASMTVTVLDDENGYFMEDKRLVLSLFALEAWEDDEPWAGRVERLSYPEGAMTVRLVSSDPNELQVPAEVTIADGESAAYFSLTPVNDNRLDGFQAVTVTAQAEGLQSALDKINILDIGVDSQTIAGWTQEDLNQLDKNTLDRFTDDWKVKLMTSLNAALFTPEDLKKLGILETGWDIGQDGKIIVPPCTKLGLPNLTFHDEQIRLGLTLMKLDCALAIGCAGTDSQQTLLRGIANILAALGDLGLTIEQQADGVLVVHSATGANFAFFPDPNATLQGGQSDIPGLNTTDNGQLRVTTEGRQRISMIPAPKSMAQFKSALGRSHADFQVKIGKHGEIRLDLADNRRAGNSRIHSAVVLDPQVVPANGLEPGLYLATEANGAADMKIVYDDHTAQRLYPTVPAPEVLRAEALKLPGVYKVEMNTDGTFTAELTNGGKYLAVPTLDTHTTPLTNMPIGQAKLETHPQGLLYTYYDNGYAIATVLALRVP